MPPSTNKCIKCGEEIPYGATFTRNENGTIQHAPGDWCKPTEPSVVKVMCTRLGCPCSNGGECESAKKVHEKPSVCEKFVGDAYPPEPLCMECDEPLSKHQQEEASFIDGNEALYNAIVKKGPSFLKGFLAESEKLNKKHLKAEIAQAVERGEVRALEWVVSEMEKNGEAQSVAETALKLCEVAIAVKDRLTALKNPTHE